MGYKFFLSYGRTDTQRDHIEEFFDDLTTEVRDQIGRDGDKPGFFDVEMEAGRNWNEDIVTALRTSKCLVCLISEDFIDSDYCGREFTAFQRRLETLKIPVSDSGLIIPVRWGVVRSDLPKVLSDLLDRDRDYPEEYETKGLLRLKKSNQYEDQYRAVVEKLGDLIVKRTRERLIPDSVSIPSLMQAPNAFRPSDAVEGLGPLGPKNAKFVYIVPQPRELPDTKKERQCYRDDGGYWWYPYQPPNDQPVGKVADDVAWQLPFPLRPTEIPASADLPAHVEIAVQNNTIVAVLVDPWSLTVPKYNNIVGSVGRLLSERSDLGEGCAILVTWNTADSDTIAQNAWLQKYVDAALLNPRAKYVFPRIEKLTDFRDHLQNFLKEVRFKIIEKEPARNVQGGIPLQTLAVPGGSAT